MLKKIWDIKLVRFLCIGVTNTAIDLTILNSLVFLLHLPAILANVISASISIATSYFMNHHLVFRSTEPHSVGRFARFFVVTGVGILAIQSLVIYIVMTILRHNAASVTRLIHDLSIPLGTKAFELNVAKIVAVLVAMCWNFVLYHLVVFRSHDSTGDQPSHEVVAV